MTNLRLSTALHFKGVERQPQPHAAYRGDTLAYRTVIGIDGIRAGRRVSVEGCS